MIELCVLSLALLPSDIDNLLLTNRINELLLMQIDASSCLVFDNSNRNLRGMNDCLADSYINLSIRPDGGYQNG
jgi:hypothetical protein